MPTSHSTPTTYAPGARVVIRDEEWIVRSVRAATFGGSAVHVSGTSELVKDKTAIFLSELDDIIELEPEKTNLVGDDSPQYRRSRIYLESLLRRSPPTDSALYVGHRGAINDASYQRQPAQKALNQLRPRILMADGVGLGKTIEVGILLSELIRRGRGDRILVVALKSILAQFQEELWARFTIPLVRLDSVGIQRLQSKIPSNMNPFYHFNRAIISIDTLKKDAKYRRYLEKCNWDVVVIDECQNVAERGTRSQRSRVAQLLGRTSDALILTSATPHDGSAESFASLMNLLEPTAVADESNYTREDIQDLFIRRFKKDIRHEVEDAFQERRLAAHKVDASAAENDVFEYLADLQFKTIDRRRTTAKSAKRGKKTRGALFRTLLLKAFLSSPAACLSTIEKRLAHKDVTDESDPAAAHDRNALSTLKSKLEVIKPGDYPKYGKLLELLREAGFGKKGSDDRIVIFSERIDTLEFLRERLQHDLKLKGKQLEVFHGSLDDQNQKELVKDFGTKSTPVRILLASDAASEGINLHYFCHRMLHFDLPWSLITLNQRNGRIDRYGQKHPPEIGWLMTVPANDQLKGDLRVIERLVEKEDAASRNIGDVGWLMGLHDSESEEERIAESIEDGEAPEEVIPDEPEKQDFLELLFGGEGQHDPAPETHDPLTLFENDLDYTRNAIKESIDDDGRHVEWHDHLDGLTLRAPDDLLRRCAYLPVELRNKHWEFKLTTDRKRVMNSIEEAREHADRWPEWQLLWELHPVAEWLNDRVLGCFDRHEAPVLHLARGVESDECVVLFQGVLSNERSQTVMVQWFGVSFRGSSVQGIRELKELVEATSLDRSASNPGGGLPDDQSERIAALLSPAVAAAREYMASLRLDRMERIQEPMRDGQKQLARWRTATLERLDATEQSYRAKNRLTKPRRDDLARERKHVEETYEHRKEWIDKGMKTVPKPYLRVAAVLIPQGA